MPANGQFTIELLISKIGDKLGSPKSTYVLEFLSNMKIIGFKL